MDFSGLPEAEYPHVLHMLENLRSMERFADNFESARSLFCFCQKWGQETTGGWQHVAGRDAILNVFHFAKVMEGIRGSFRECPTFRTRVDHPRLREATKSFAENFPDFELLRHAVAHAGELYETIEKRDANMAGSVDAFGINVDESSRISVGDAISDNFFLQNIEGRMVALEISEASRDRLQATRNLFVSGFPDGATDFFHPGLPNEFPPLPER